MVTYDILTARKYFGIFWLPDLDSNQGPAD